MIFQQNRKDVGGRGISSHRFRIHGTRVHD
jgi:hypothetical protein